ncbi:hypothetical protein K5E_19850 [Enterococcus thailandicus]|uniref:Uncharacterized protein n=1 Tax=Enterococcus thailandicus TaxID=417368 RepID=A0A179ERJ5_ENTTH|nr:MULTISPECIES: hypothetical protein [Enterococcus]ASZ06403.1 hypothetical protein CK496_00100 [Enterococcus thailandicus]MDA3964778.1 hypothetical protein [Enterococcus thailandicus]MDK4352289.1 hypothetical protein [Enterococcus thailandicus]MDT2735037.1 hypothetical protein [Enterococcus thailandicus]MDT2751290.1 hypothetical protein [Enterococcus thailandicus]
MGQKNILGKVFLLILFLIIASSIISLFVGLLSGFLWFAIKLLIPLAIAIWLVRLITGTSGNNRRYY